MYSDAKPMNQSIHEVFELLSCVYQRLRLLQQCKCFFFQYGGMSQQVDERIIKKKYTNMLRKVLGVLRKWKE